MKYQLRNWMNKRAFGFLFIFLLTMCFYLLASDVGLMNPLPKVPGWSIPDNVGYPVNTSGWESSPSISPDGAYLYFTYSNFDLLTYNISGKRNQTGPDLGLNPQGLGNIMVSYKTNTGWWSKPKPFGVNEALALNDGLFSQDGKTFYFSGLRKNNLGGPTKSDIYVSSIKHGKLTSPMNLGTPVNTRYHESNPWISPDGKLLLFESDRPGGLGGYDIWMSRYSKGRWQSPVNLGAPVNSSRNERQPFMTYDGKSLYFSGDSRWGENDIVIYCSNIQKGKWAEPQVVISGMAEKPSLTKDGSKLFFMHIYKMDNGSYNADIMVALRY